MNKNNKKNTIIDPNEMLGELMEEALKLEVPIENKQESKISKENFDTLISEISKEFKILPALSLVGLFLTLQSGGTSNSKRSNVKVIIGQTLFESKKINSLILKTCKGCTPRQFAKIFSNQILLCASKYNIIGNAYIYLIRFHSNLLNVDKKDENEKYWCADFQIDNLQCPEYIRLALKQRYKDKFKKS